MKTLLLSLAFALLVTAIVLLLCFLSGYFNNGNTHVYTWGNNSKLLIGGLPIITFFLAFYTAFEYLKTKN